MTSKLQECTEDHSQGSYCEHKPLQRKFWQTNRIKRHFQMIKVILCFPSRIACLHFFGSLDKEICSMFVIVALPCICYTRLLLQSSEFVCQFLFSYMSFMCYINLWVTITDMLFALYFILFAKSHGFLINIKRIDLRLIK